MLVERVGNPESVQVPILERHGYNEPLDTASYENLRARVNTGFESGKPEYQRKPKVIRAIEVVNPSDFIAIPQGTGHPDYESYLQAHYKPLAGMLSKVGLNLEIARVMVVEPDVYVAASYNNDWLARGFKDANGIEGWWKWYTQPYEPWEDNTWNGEFATSRNHEWCHRVMRIPDVYRVDYYGENQDHPALNQMPQAWRNYLDRYRWGDNLMNGGRKMEMGPVFKQMLRRRIRGGWLQDDARTIPEGGSDFPNAIPDRVVIALGEEWSGAQVKLYRSRGVGDDPYNNKILKAEPLVTKSARRKETSTRNAGVLKKGDVFLSEHPFADLGKMIPGHQSLCLLTAEKDGQMAFQWIAWSELFMGRRWDTLRLEINLADTHSLPPTDFNWGVKLSNQVLEK